LDLLSCLSYHQVFPSVATNDEVTESDKKKKSMHIRNFLKKSEIKNQFDGVDIAIYDGTVYGSMFIVVLG
jgi:hypothetical protein